MTDYYVRKMGGPAIGPEESGLFYWFDGSDAAATDPNAVWTDETNADDSDISTVAFTTSSGNESTAQIKIEGTDAPASGGTISSVYLWVYLGPGNVSTASNVLCYTDGEGESLKALGLAESPGEWVVAGGAMSTPSGGWTWAKVQALEFKVYQSTGSDRLEFAAAGVMVHTTVEGESTSNPFRTVTEASDAVAAGDNVYIGAGVYREAGASGVLMDTSGTSGNIISYIGDIDGEKTGDPGLVVISAYNDEASDAARAYCLNLNDKEFLTFKYLNFDGGTIACIGPNASAGNLAYEEVTFDTCVFQPGHLESDIAVYIDLNEGATPTSQGLKFTGCMILGTVRIVFNENATAEVNCKAVFENNVFRPSVSTTNSEGSGLFWDRGTVSTYWVGGAAITNNLFDGCYYGLFVDGVTTTPVTHLITVRNNVFLANQSPIDATSTSGPGVDTDYNTFLRVNTADGDVPWGDNDHVEDRTIGMWGGIHDHPLRAVYGWSPYRPYEPISLVDGIDNYYSNVIGGADSSVAPATDMYGNARPMGGQGVVQSVYHFDASDAGPTDNDAAWTSDGNAFDGDSATLASTTTAGTETTNELRGEGTDAPATGGTIESVEARFYFGATTGAAGYVRVYTDSEGESLLNTNWTGDDDWRAWLPVSTPSGGWTWAKVQALEVITWLDTGGTLFEIGAIQIRVTHTGRHAGDDRGAVEARPLPVQNTGTVITGPNSFELRGATYNDHLVAVKAQSTTVSVNMRYNSDYTGSLPQMQVLNIPGVADQTDTMVAAANTTEELSAVFTPTAAGICRVRLISRDTSIDGLAFYDDLNAV